MASPWQELALGLSPGVMLRDRRARKFWRRRRIELNRRRWRKQLALHSERVSGPTGAAKEAPFPHRQFERELLNPEGLHDSKSSIGT